MHQHFNPKETEISLQKKNFSTHLCLPAKCPPLTPSPFFCVPPSPLVYIMHTVSLIRS